MINIVRTVAFQISTKLGRFFMENKSVKELGPYLQTLSEDIDDATVALLKGKLPIFIMLWARTALTHTACISYFGQ